MKRQSRRHPPPGGASSNAQADQQGTAAALTYLAALQTVKSDEDCADVVIASIGDLLRLPNPNGALFGFARAMGVAVEAKLPSAWIHAIETNQNPAPTREDLRREILKWLKAMREGQHGRP